MNNDNYNSDDYSFSGDETASWLEKARRRANQHNDESLSSSGVSNISFHFDPVNYQEPITSIQSGTPPNDSIAIRPDPPSSTQIHHYTHQRHSSLPLTPSQPVLSTTTYTTTNFVSPPPSTAPAVLPSPAPAKSSAFSVAKKPPPTKKKSKYPIYKSPVQPKIKDVPGYIQLNKDTKVFAITSRSGGTMTANASCKSTDSSSEDVFEARRKRRAEKKKTKEATKKVAAAKKAAPKKAAPAKKAAATKKAAAVAKKAETVAKKEAAAVAKKSSSSNEEKGSSNKESSSSNKEGTTRTQ